MKRITLTAGDKPFVIGKRGKWFTLPRGRKVHVSAPSGQVRLTKGESQTFVLEPDTLPLPTGPILSQFLWTPIKHTLLVPAYPVKSQDERLDRYVQAGDYRDIDLAAMNMGHPDTGKPGDNPFGQSHWFTDSVKHPELLLHALKGARARGLRVTLWMFTDDWHGYLTLDRALKAVDSIMPWADPLVARYIPALEYRETFTSDEHGELINRMRTHTKRPIYIHSGDNDIGGSTWPVAGIFVQYPRNQDTSVADLTKRAVAKWGKARVICGEFENPTALSESRRLSVVALAAGASGTAQG